MAVEEWLDELTRGLSGATTRRAAARGVIATIAAGFMAVVLPRWAPTKKNSRQNKNKRKKRKGKKPGNPQPTGRCTLDQTAEGSVLVVEVADSFEGKPLTLEHQATLPAVGDFRQHLVVELGQQFVVQFDVDKPNDADSRLRARYGTGFTGIHESVFILDDGATTLGGSIDGRDLVPRSVAAVEQDPDGWEFVDGGPPPATSADPNLLSALSSVLERAGNEIAGCAGGQLRVAAAPLTGLQLAFGFFPMSDVLGGGVASARKHTRKRRQKTRRVPGRVRAESNPDVCDEASDTCLVCWAGCFTTQAACCAASLGLACGGCALAYEECLDACDAGVCCPVECGNDFPSSCCCEGETCCKGTCCKKGESCCEGNCCAEDEVCWPGGVCCKNGAEFCAGACCPQNTFCKEGICCRENEAPCFGECCPAGETCREPGLCCPPALADCNGICCPSELDSCQGTVCCPLGQVICGGSCCDPGDICKPPEGGGEGTVCCPNDLVCGEVCCDELSRCIDPAHSICCGFAIEVCDGVCCADSGDICIGRLCCPSARACGATCCPPGHFCASPGAEPGAADCRPCDEGQIPCPISVAGAPDCCPQNTQCCGDGTCCVQGVPCCDKGDGPKCDPTCIS